MLQVLCQQIAVKSVLKFEIHPNHLPYEANSNAAIIIRLLIQSWLGKKNRHELIHCLENGIALHRRGNSRRWNPDHSAAE
jgi:hypothetical protein